MPNVHWKFRSNIDEMETNHPWLFNNKEYQKVHEAWNRARKGGNIEEIRELQKKRKKFYEKSKAKYIRHNIQEYNGNRSELYKFLKFKSNDRVSLPQRISYNGDVVNSNDIARYMAIHLSSAFAEGDTRLYDGDIEANLYNLWSQIQLQAHMKRSYHQLKCLI